MAAIAVGLVGAAPGGRGSKPTFSDVTEAAGIRWGITRTALRGWNLVETMGGHINAHRSELGGLAIAIDLPPAAPLPEAVVRDATAATVR